MTTLRPWKPAEVPFAWFRRKGSSVDDAVGILVLTQVCGRGVGLGPEQKLIGFRTLLEDWEWTDIRNPDYQWQPCGVES